MAARETDELRLQSGSLVISPVQTPHAGWQEAFQVMAQRAEDAPLIPGEIRNEWDEDGWEFMGKQGYVDLDQIRTVDKTRLIKRSDIWKKHIAWMCCRAYPPCLRPEHNCSFNALILTINIQ